YKNTAVNVAAGIALARLQSVHDAVDNIPKFAMITIGVNNDVGKAVHDAVNSIGANARGTNYWRGGPTWVGEEGPEILNLPTGSKITPHRQAMAMAGQSGGGGYGVGDQKLEINLILDGAKIQTSLVTLKRQRGGVSLGLG